MTGSSPTGRPLTAPTVGEGLTPGSIVWVDFDPIRGREQRGLRPALVVAGADYLASVPDLVIVVPLTTADRGWQHHVVVRGRDAGLPRRSFAMTEQPRTISRERVNRHSGRADDMTMAAVRGWLRDFFAL